MKVIGVLHEHACSYGSARQIFLMYYPDVLYLGMEVVYIRLGCIVNEYANIPGTSREYVW